MSFKIDTHTLDHSHIKSETSQSIQTLKTELLLKLQDFPYENINLEKDLELAELIYDLSDELKLDLNCSLIAKETLITKLKLETESMQNTSKFQNPARDVCSYFDLVSKMQTEKKQKHYDALSHINGDLNLLGQALSLFQTASVSDSCDFSNDKDKQLIIDHVKKQFGLPPETSSYVWPNKNEVTAFLNQKIKELTHRSSEVMLHLQHDADQLKSMVDITKNILDDDAKLKDYILRKSQS